MTQPDTWDLADDIARGLAGEIPGAKGRFLVEDAAQEGGGDHFFATGPTDDRSPWYLDSEPPSRSRSMFLRFESDRISSPRKSLTLILTILYAQEEGSRGWRWRLAARVAEISYPKVAEQASHGRADAVRLLPLYAWVRWRILSEPFRVTVGSPSDTPGSSSVEQPDEASHRQQGDPDSPKAFARGVFGGRYSLNRRVRESRNIWAEVLLKFQDLPTLGLVNIETEGTLLVFADKGGTQLLKTDDFSGSGSLDRSPDTTFVTWFSREFFSRRFMVREMWETIQSPWKYLTAISAVLTVMLALVSVWVIPPDSPLLDLDTPGDYWRLAVAVVFLVGLIVTFGSLVAGFIWTEDGERYAYPFLLRFGAGTVLGSAAVLTMRAGWIRNLSDPGAGNQWRPIILVGGLVVTGFVYLLVEARLHDTSPVATFRRAGAVWMIGLAWALTVAAIDVLAIAPVFTEDYFVFAEPETRLLGFAVTALASLDLGIFLQVLWEDRPVPYPLGALRFSKHE